MLDMNSLGDERYILEKLHKKVIICYLPLMFLIIILAVKFSLIVGEQDLYSDSTSVANHWEACIAQPSLVSLPLNQIIAAGKLNTTNYLTTCIFENPTCSTTDDGFQCVTDGVVPCAASSPKIDINNPNIPMGQFGQGLAAVGLQSILFSVAGHFALARALRHPSWLPATIALLIWTSIAVLTYYTVNPVLPVPNVMNTTLLVLMKYMKWDSFTAMNGGDNKLCYGNYNFLNAFG